MGEKTASLLIENLDEDLDGECKIRSVRMLRLNKLKLFILLPWIVLLTAFTLLLVLRKNKRLLAFLVFDDTNLQDATYVLIEGTDGDVWISEVIGNSFLFKNLRYTCSTQTPISYCLTTSPYFSNYLYPSLGLSQPEHLWSIQRYGPCQHVIEIPGILEYLLEELLGIFFILQYITSVIYILEGIVIFAIILLAFSFITTIVNYLMLRSSFVKIKEAAEIYSTVTVVREGVRRKVESRDLAPGDIFVPEGVLPCDCLIVAGEAFVNEVSLTGENIPISKTPQLDPNMTKLESSNWLHEGTSIIETRGEVLALAVYTGFITKKGRIFRNILFKEHSQPEFFKYAFLFLLEIFVYCLVVYLAMIPSMIEGQISSGLMVLRFFDMVSWAIPPALPICFNLCYSLSMYRLRQQGIYGTEPFKTIVSGKVKIMCFDKTGTLTLNSMQLHSLVELSPEGASRQILVGEGIAYQRNELIIKIMASCHSVRRINEQLMGDELDLRMFEHSEYSYVESIDLDVKLILQKKSSRIEVLRINQFQSRFQDMSVMVKDNDTHYIFMKGAPEKIHSLSKVKISNFNTILEGLSLAGFRCLAIAYREVADPNTYLAAQREQFSEGLTICGLVAFSNSLKKDTISTIRSLKDAQIEVKVVTGDNIYVGVETAMRAGIIGEEPVWIFRGESQKEGGDYYVGEALEKTGDVVRTSQVQVRREEFVNSVGISMAVDQSFLEQDPNFPPTTKIFARISPEGKATIVKRLRHNQQQRWQQQSFLQRLFSRTPFKVGMCGDGANDILAIKQADMGIGITQTDSNFAAHFAIPDIGSIDYIVREGKCTLQNVIEVFRYYVGISVLKFVGSMICVSDQSSFTDNMFTYFNYVSTLEIVLFLSFSKPLDSSSMTSPNDNLLSLENHLVFLGTMVFESLGLLTVKLYLITTPTYIATPSKPRSSWEFSSQTTTSIFLCSHLLYILHTFWVFRDKPWKKHIWHNYVLSVWLSLVIAVNVVLFFFTKDLTPFFGMVELPGVVQGVVFGITMGTVAVCLGWKLGLDSLHLHNR